MQKLTIIYYSSAGHTAELAKAIERGAKSVDEVDAETLVISGDDIEKGRYANDAIMAKLDKSDAIVFGSPTFMGGAAAQFKAFADASADRWYSQTWRDKVASGFTVSGALSGDKYNTLQYFQTLAMQHGMVWVGLAELPDQPNGVNRLGSWSGAMAIGGHGEADGTPGREDLLTGEVLGKRVASYLAKH